MIAPIIRVDMPQEVVWQYCCPPEEASAYLMSKALAKFVPM